MKRLIISTFLGVLSLAATAQTGSDQSDQSVRVPGYQIELPAKAIHIFPGDFDPYKGTYDLSNGDSMVLSNSGHRIFATVGDRPRAELVRAAHNTFVAIDKSLKMTLDEDIDGIMKGEMLMVVPHAAGLASAGESDVIRMVVSR